LFSFIRTSSFLTGQSAASPLLPWRHGEGVILVPTAAHWEAIRPRLEVEGVNIQEVQSRGQFSVVDADELLPRFMGQAMPDAPVFPGLAGEVVARARGRNQYPRVRWWGEMVNVLWERGNATASMALEDLFDQLAHEQEIAIFCSFLMDNFDGEIHTRMLPRLGENHSHLIPVEDYGRLETAVADALREIVGPVEASVLEKKLLEHYTPPFKMPPSVAQLDFRNHRRASLALAALFVVATTLSLRAALDRFDELLHGDQYVDTSFGLDTQTFKVDALDTEAERAGLRKGDILVAANGRTVHGWSDIFGPVRRARTGDHLLLRVKRPDATGSVEEDISVPLRRFTYVGYAPGSAGYVATIVSRILTPLFCLALGFWVAAVRISDRAAWTLLLLMLSVANLITDGRTIFGHEDAVQPFLTGLTAMLIRLGPLALVYFGIIFPETLAFDRKFPWIKWIVIGPMLVRAGLSGIAVGLLLHHRDLTSSLLAILRAVDPTDIELSLIGLFFVILGYKTVTATTGDARRRFLLLDTGIGVGLLPLLATLTWMTIGHRVFRGWPAMVSIAALLIFPLTMAYVIVVHRAMDVRVVLRQGLQYLLATSGVRILQIAVSAGIIVLAASMSANANVATRVGVIAVGFALVAALGVFADRLRRWIDRRFFREAYETDRILADLAVRVQTMVETGPLLETVTSRVAEALHVPRIAIFLEGNGAFRPAYALGYGSPPSGTLNDQSLTLQRLRQTRHTRVGFEDAHSWLQLTDREERATLEELKPELLLSLSLKEKVLGIMSLGPKRSEEPFSAIDLRLLSSVAAQTGLALENGRLTEAIKEETRAREKQNRELELGREVQERLFPQEYPTIPGLDYAGACRPALGVGGDYYDFIPMSNGGLGFTIGDVSGKGIPAALLMATLRAFLRGQVIDHETDLSAVIANLNRLVFESSAPNRYATFFLGVFDTASRVLNYVNAGHNAPIVICRGGEVVRLEAGGSVVGLMRSGSWVQNRVKLETGDLLVAFTDGISEAMNHTDDEWGEERLIETARAMRGSPAKVILENIVQSADRFAAGAPQYDDMTLIVAQVG
jgi:phosphoserine phosphatase RsbU/P